MKSHALSFKEDEAGTTAIAVVHASPWATNRGFSLSFTAHSGFHNYFFDRFVSSSRLMRRVAYLFVCRCHILSAVVSMVVQLDSVFTFTPLSLVPDSTLLPAALLLQVCRTLIWQTPEIACPAVSTALSLLERYLSCAYSARAAPSNFSPEITSSSSTDTISLLSVPEVLLLEYYPSSAAAEETTGSGTTASPTSPTSPAASPINGSTPSASPSSSPTDKIQGLFCNVCKNLSTVSARLFRESVVAGLMGFARTQQSLLAASRDNLQKVYDFAATDAEFGTSALFDALDYDLSRINADYEQLTARLGDSAQPSGLSFEDCFAETAKQSLISCVSFIRNTAEGLMPFNTTTRAALVDNCQIVANFLIVFSAMIDAGNPLVWVPEADVLLDVIRIHVINAMADLEDNLFDWVYHNDNEDVLEVSNKMREAMEEIYGKFKLGPGHFNAIPSGYPSTTVTETAETIIDIASLPAVAIQRLDSGTTDGNATPLSEAGAVVPDTVSEVSEEDSASASQKKKKKKSKKNKKKKNFRTY